MKVISIIEKHKVDLMDVAPNQIASIAASLDSIP